MRRRLVNGAATAGQRADETTGFLRAWQGRVVDICVTLVRIWESGSARGRRSAGFCVESVAYKYLVLCLSYFVRQSASNRSARRAIVLSGVVIPWYACVCCIR